LATNNRPVSRADEFAHRAEENHEDFGARRSGLLLGDAFCIQKISLRANCCESANFQNRGSGYIPSAKRVNRILLDGIHILIEQRRFIAMRYTSTLCVKENFLSNFV
jgi:hypothetical protein